MRRYAALSRAATLSAWALALCPTTVFFSAIYTDSLYLALSIAVFRSLKSSDGANVSQHKVLASG